MDCPDGQDEIECDGCSADAFYCKSERKCISGSARCNGIVNCKDETDESNCACAGL